MKKHQKFLVGLMILGLAGGVGTAFALTREGSGDTTATGGTDGAIYLEWTDGTNSTPANVTMKDFVANVVQYSPVVVSPKSSKSVVGEVSVAFTLSVGDENELPGFTVDVYEYNSYTTSPAATDTSKKSLKIDADSSDANTYSSTFDVNLSTASHKTTNYYLLGFKWDGSPVSDSSKTFGGTLTISASFSAE